MHRLVYKRLFDTTPIKGLSFKDALKADMERKIETLKVIANAPVEYILDSVMYLSKSESEFIKTRAFSTLGSLSKYSSECKSVKAQLDRDIAIPNELTSKDYLGFITERL